MSFASWFAHALLGKSTQQPYCDWEPGRLLVEPGISEVDHGRWSRREFRCRRCGAVRPMWQFVDTSTVFERCPSR